MPTQSKSSRANAKYNVTTDFPHLGLHAAAASGDVGLVKYALSHGQPVNSVLGGVLPLHAACAGGDELIVKLLIQHGADVNAARLPLRYSDRNNRDTSSGPIVGTSGSTPLHFAAANGHANIIRTLLFNGARADLADKHGVTPQDVARENGWLECAELLREWVVDKDRDLNSLNRLTPGYGMDSGSGSGYGGRGGKGSDGSTSRDKSPCRTEVRKRLHLKRSIDHALNALNTIKGTGTPPGELFDKALLLAPSASASASSSSAVHPSIGPVQSAPSSRSDTFTGRRPSLQAERQTVSARYRRPKSAESGTDASGASPSPRKLGSKLSLLNLFKKSNIDGSSSSIASSAPPAHAPTHTPFSEYNVIPIGPTSSHSPALSTNSSLPMSSPPRQGQMALSSSPRDNPMVEYQRHRMGSSASASGNGSGSIIARGAHPRSTSESHDYSQQSTSQRPSQDQFRTRSGSTPDESGGGAGSAHARPGILRAHQRSSSSGLSQPQSQSQLHPYTHSPPPPPSQLSKASSSRNIRFDASSSSSSLAGRAQSPGAARQLSGTGSGSNANPALAPAQESRLRTVSLSAQAQTPPPAAAATLGRKTSLPNGAEENGQPERRRGREQVLVRQSEVLEDEDDEDEMLRTARPQATPPIIVDVAEDEGELDGEDDEDEEEYGVPIDQSRSFLPQISSQPSRDRATSPALSSSPSTPSSHSAAADAPPATLCSGAFPFSINVPPPSEADDLGAPVAGDPTTLSPESGLVTGRLRGESTSSTSTDNSHDHRHRHPRSASSATTTSTGLATPNTPHYMELMPSPRGPACAKGLPPVTMAGAGAETDSPRAEFDELPLTPASAGTGGREGGLALRRGASAPMDIDLSKISTHAQAEALVRRTQASILNMGMEDGGDDALMARTPLSAKLLALGESMALERKFKEEEEKRAAFETLTGREKVRRGSHGDERMQGARRMRKESARSDIREKASYDALGIRRPSYRHKGRAASHDDVFTSDSEPDQQYLQNTHRHPQGQPHPRSFSHLHPHQNTHTPASRSPSQSQPYSHHRTYSHSHGTRPTHIRAAITPEPGQDCPDLLDASAPLHALGVPLSRCSTAPSQATLDSAGLGAGAAGPAAAAAARRGNQQQIRHMMSANKLTRMGFGADSLAGLSASASLSSSGGALGGLGGGASVVGGSGSLSAAAAAAKGKLGGGEGRRFRPIRSIMQSLQGRS